MSATIENVSGKSFDYIICGGGTAGIVLAARLTEDPDISVAVLEAGPANLDDPDVLRPASYQAHFGNDALCWPYETVTQKGLGDRTMPWARGKGIGGSSAINFMCWTKPPALDIDDIERLGNPGWNWANYQHYLAKTEGFVEPDEAVQKKHNMNFDNWQIGRQGPLKLAYPATIDEVTYQLRETLHNAGIHQSPEPMNGDPSGACLILNTYDPATHTRSYAATAFYTPNKDRPNLTVLVSAHVRQVLTTKGPDGTLVATGVEFDHSGKTHVVSAKKEVILSAGALSSPHILELSGIGNKEVLKKANIPLKHELTGVGKNVQDHLLIGLTWEVRDDIDFENWELLFHPETRAKHLELHASGQGLFTTGIVGFAFTDLQTLSDKSNEFIEAAKARVVQGAGTFPPGIEEQFKLLIERLEHGSPIAEIATFNGLWSKPNPPVKGKKYASFAYGTSHPFSRGTIHSTSNDPYKFPELDPQVFSEEIDLDIFVELTKFVRTMPYFPPLRDIIVKEHNPGAEVQTDEQIKDHQHHVAHDRLVLHAPGGQWWCSRQRAQGIRHQEPACRRSLHRASAFRGTRDVHSVCTCRNGCGHHQRQVPVPREEVGAFRRWTRMSCRVTRIDRKRWRCMFRCAI